MAQGRIHLNSSIGFPKTASELSLNPPPSSIIDLRPVTCDLETFDQSDEETLPDQHFDNFNNFDNFAMFEHK